MASAPIKTIFTVGHAVQWRTGEFNLQKEQELEEIKLALGDGPFIVEEIEFLDERQRAQMGYSLLLKLEGIEEKISGYWFEPAE